MVSRKASLSNLEADGLRQHKTLSTKNRDLRLQWAWAHQGSARSDDSGFLLRRVVGSESMDPACLVSTVHAGGGVIVWGGLSLPTLGPLTSVNHHLNATAYLSVVGDHVLPFMATIF